MASANGCVSVVNALLEADAYVDQQTKVMQYGFLKLEHEYGM